MSGSSGRIQATILASVLAITGALIAMPVEAVAGKGKPKKIKVETLFKSASVTVSQPPDEPEMITYQSQIAGEAKKKGTNRKQRKAAQKACVKRRYFSIYLNHDGIEYFVAGVINDAKGKGGWSEFRDSLPAAGDTISWSYTKKRTSIQQRKRVIPVVCKAGEGTAVFAG